MFILETSRRINKALKTSWRHLCKTFWWCSKEVWPRQINSCWRGLKVVCLRGRQKTFSRRLHQDAHLLTKLYPIHWLKSNISTDGTTFPKSWNIKENYKSIKETSYLYQWCFSFTSNSTGLVLLFLLLLFFCFFLFWFFDFFFCCCCFFETTKLYISKSSKTTKMIITWEKLPLNLLNLVH